MFISRYFSFGIKIRVLLFLQFFKKNNFLSLQLNSSKKKVFIFLAADYGNLGDVAITYAQTKFIKKVLPSYVIIDVPVSKTIQGIASIKKKIKPGDIITIIGGGNLGDMYDQLEFFRQLIVEKFPENKIVSFPQTLDFSNTVKGQKALQKAILKYSQHQRLIFVAREKKSFKKMKRMFVKNKVILCPDIVLSLDKLKPEFNRKGVVLCLREDAEKLLTEKHKNELLKLVKEKFNTLKEYDTHINKEQLTLEERNLELKKILIAFKKAEIVITDRLHGMIFCYITNTPCIVFNNSNHKIMSSYEWIKESKNIKLMLNFSEEKIIELLNNKSINKYSELKIINKFNELKNALRR